MEILTKLSKLPLIGKVAGVVGTVAIISAPIIYSITGNKQEAKEKKIERKEWWEEQSEKSKVVFGEGYLKDGYSVFDPNPEYEPRTKVQDAVKTGLYVLSDNLSGSSEILDGIELAIETENKIKENLETKAQKKPIKKEKTKGTFTDKRDNQEYKWVKIGDQIWMAENLNYSTSYGSWCYDNKKSNCETYGKLYNWNVALKSCPKGWHLPSNDDWEKLGKYISKDNGGYNQTKGDWEKIGMHLKSKTGWRLPYISSVKGTDDYGFSALGGGYRSDDGKLMSGLKIMGNWWTSSKKDIKNAFSRTIYDEGKLFKESYPKQGGYSVRCIKNK